jgi:hypothetical protein
MLSGAGTAHAGFISVLLSAGPADSATPSSSGNFQFTNPTGSPLLGINQLGGVSSAQANTAGGSAFFGGLGLPIVLNVADGMAALSTSNAPSGAVPSSGLSSVAPTAPNTNATVLNANLMAPTANGSQVLSVSVTDGLGTSLGIGQVTVPGGGWFVLGLSPDATPPVVPPVVDPPPVVPPVVPPTTPPPSTATPEPATLALAGLGLPLVAVARRLRRNRVTQSGSTRC